MNSEGVDEKLCMLTGMIQKIGEVINGKLNIFKEEWREVQKQIQELKKDTEIIKMHVEELKKGKGSRETNIVIFGWKCEENENNFDTYNRVRELFSKVLQISSKNIHIAHILIVIILNPYFTSIKTILFFPICTPLSYCL